MRKAFTLVELLVVVVVIAILASVAFRLAGVGGDSSARNTTVAKMQRLENAISGYYAAYGSYPPVALQGRSRNIFYKVNDSGIQQIEENPDASEVSWDRVEAACRAQPVAVRFPFRQSVHEYVRKVSESLVENPPDGVDPNDMVFDALDNPDQLSGKKDKGDWSETQLFQFGLLSYLLPRYLVMMGYGNDGQGGRDDAAAENLYDGFVQWGDNNSMPCRFKDGLQYDSWKEVNAALGRDNEKWTIAALPSQAVTARWLPNLEGILEGGAFLGTIYGVSLGIGGCWLSPQDPPPTSEIYSSGDSQSGSGGGKSQPYVLDKITCRDGWYRDFYYYSPPPYQGYRLWSAGPNGKTFPPWFPDEEIERLRDRDTIRNWLSDDIVHMSN